MSVTCPPRPRGGLRGTGCWGPCSQLPSLLSRRPMRPGARRSWRLRTAATEDLAVRGRRAGRHGGGPGRGGVDPSRCCPTPRGPSRAWFRRLEGLRDDGRDRAAGARLRRRHVVRSRPRRVGRSHPSQRPEFEIADAKALVDLVAKRPDVLLDATGDPRVGVMGGSYGGALGLMLAGADSGSTPSSRPTWNDRGRVLPAVGVTTTARRLLDASPWRPQARSSRSGPPTSSSAPTRSILSLPPPGRTANLRPGLAAVRTRLCRRVQNAPDAATCGRFDPTICAGFLDASVTGEPSDALVTLLRQHSPKPTWARSPRRPCSSRDRRLPLRAGARRRDGAGARCGWDARCGALERRRPRCSEHPREEETEAGHAWLDHYVRDGAGRESALPVAGFTFPTPRAAAASRPTCGPCPGTRVSTAPRSPRSASRSPPRPEGCCTRPEASRRRWSPFPVCQPRPHRVVVPDRGPARAVHVLRDRAGAAQCDGRGLADHDPHPDLRPADGHAVRLAVARLR